MHHTLIFDEPQINTALQTILTSNQNYFDRSIKEDRENKEKQLSDLLDQLKANLNNILNAYLEVRSRPNKNSLKLYGIILSAIESIQTIETGRKAYETIAKLFTHSNGKFFDKHSPKLCEHSKKIEQQLARYFHPKQGSLIPKKHPKHMVSLVQNDMISWVHTTIHDRCRIFISQKGWENDQVIYDDVLRMIQDYKAKKAQFSENMYVKFVNEINPEQSIYDQCHANAYEDEYMDAWGGSLLEEDLHKKALWYKELERKNYVELQQELDDMKSKIRQKMKAKIDSVDVTLSTTQFDAVTGDVEIDAMFALFLQALSKDKSDEAQLFFKTTPIQFFTRLKLVSSPEEYQAFLDEFIGAMQRKFEFTRSASTSTSSTSTISHQVVQEFEVEEEKKSRKRMTC